MKSLSVPFAALLLVLGGCAASTPPAESSSSFAPDDLVLQVRITGGMMPVEMYLTELPLVSIYGDGRVITTGPVPAIYPGPALPSVQVQHISPADIAKLTRKAINAGVGATLDLGMPNVADAPSTQIKVRTGSGLKITDAPALGIGGSDGMTSGQRIARRKLKDLVDDLTDLEKTLDGAIDKPTPFTPAAVAAVPTAWRASTDPVLKDPPPVAWPGPALPGEHVTNRPVSCVTATGAEATAVLTAAARANARTPWTSAGEPWSVAFRPLLPHESDCTDLGK